MFYGRGKKEMPPKLNCWRHFIIVEVSCLKMTLLRCRYMRCDEEAIL